jgi:AcrR family transcriptional regulator
MNKNESKYFNTAIKMDKALIKLIEKKDFEYITIKEICETAQVNRSTFYLHYSNTSDLLKETTKYITDGFLAYFDVDKSSVIGNCDNCNLNELIFITPEYLSPYLAYIKENQRIFKISLHNLGTMDFENVYNRMFEFIFKPILQRFNIPQSHQKYMMRFYLTGITAIVMEWIDNDCNEEIDTISNIIIECVIHNI